MNQTLAPTNRRNHVFVWAIVGILALLLQAQIRLGQIAWEALSSGTMSKMQLALCALWVLMNAYMEGYRGFQMRFVPRVLARAHHLAMNPGCFPAVLAPIYAMAYVSAAKKARYAAWGVTILVIIAIVFVRRMPQPWRGIIDAGVVVGLAWGSISLAVGAISRVLGDDPQGDPNLPEPTKKDAH